MALFRPADYQYQARRTTVLNRLIRSAYADPMEAERWLAQWEDRAVVARINRESPTYWSAALRWIADRRSQQ